MEGMCWGSGGEAPSRQSQGGPGAESSAAENSCIFYLSKVNFSAFNCIICCNNVLYIIQTQNSLTSHDSHMILNIQLLQ